MEAKTVETIMQNFATEEKKRLDVAKRWIEDIEETFLEYFDYFWNGNNKELRSFFVEGKNYKIILKKPVELEVSLQKEHGLVLLGTLSQKLTKLTGDLFWDSFCELSEFVTKFCEEEIKLIDEGNESLLVNANMDEYLDD